MISRRQFLRLVGLSGSGVSAAAFLAACGDESDPPQASISQPTAAPSTARSGPSTGELRAAEPFLPTALDADSGTAGNALMAFGVAEALMRYTTDLRPEPWLASKLERVDPLTWRVTLRDDATFWDGSKVDAAAVVSSIRRSLELLPSAAGLVPKDAVLTPEGQVLTIKTPQPMGLMDHNLTSPSLTIKKPGSGENLVYTGAFTVKDFTARETMTLEAYPNYRGGPARLKTVRIRQVADASARVLGLQAGDVDVSHALLPSDVARIKSTGQQAFTSPWARQHMLILNTKAAPLDDVNVRKAYSLAIDREALRTGVMDGTGQAAYGFSPENIGHKNIQRTQKYDPAEAQRLLDAAGWRLGSAGFREKNGQRLAFKIGTYSGRAELEQFAVVIKDQLKAVGVDLEIEKFQDVETALANNAFQSSTYSIGSAAFGDLSQLISTLYVPSARNKDRYDNPRVTTLFQEYVQSNDATRQAELLRQMQELIGQDVPVVYLFNPAQVIGASAKLKGYAPHPLERDKYTPDMYLG